MKKYLLTWCVGALIFGSSCDSMNQESLHSDSDLLDSQSDNFGSLTDPNARTSVQWPYQLIQQTERNNRMMENAYPLLMSRIPQDLAEEYRQNSRSKEDFVKKLVVESLRLFDENIFQHGKFLSYPTQRKHQAMAGGEHEFEYDILAFEDEEAAFDYYLKIPDIEGESEAGEPMPSESVSFNFGKIKLSNGSGAAKGCDWCNDSLPPIKKPQLEEMIEFLKKVDGWNADPSPTQAGLMDLELSSGINPIAIGLLLPAIQKVREAARIEARGKADILIESLSHSYGLGLDREKGKFLRYGGSGGLFQLMAEDYEEDGDLDWASVQLGRSRFEWEMLFFWSRYWDQKSTASSGR